MKKKSILIPVITIILVAILLLVQNAFAPKTIILDRMQIIGVDLRKVQVLEGEPAAPVWKWQAGIQYRMLNLTGDAMVGTSSFVLTDPQALKIRQFLKPFVDTIKTNTDISIVENFTDPPE